jgi:uncharacterized protein (DUF2267 family)
VILATLAPLRDALSGEPLGTLLATLPLALARAVADAELNLGARVTPSPGARAYLAEVSRLLLYPPPIAATYVDAVFAAAKAVLAPDAAEEIRAKLPGEIAELWRDAA